MKQFFTYVLLVIFLQSCNYFTFKKDNRVAVARVNETYLYKAAFKSIFPKDISKNDSILLAKNYINNWVKQQLLLQKAQINLVNKMETFNELVKKYQEDLFINSYKEAVVKQYLNTEITSDDIHKFYTNNNQNFKLNEELVQIKYIKIGKDLLNKKALIKLFKSSKKADLDSLQTKELFLKTHHLNDSSWIKYSELILKIPIFKSIDKKQLLKKGKFIQKEDSLSLYLASIKQVLYRNQIAPKSYISPTIKQMILHQRKLLLIRNIEKTIIEDASKKQQFEIF